MNHKPSSSQRFLRADVDATRLPHVCLTAQLEKGELSESQQQLIFNYKLAFEAMTESRDGGEP